MIYKCLRCGQCCSRIYMPLQFERDHDSPIRITDSADMAFVKQNWYKIGEGVIDNRGYEGRESWQCVIYRCIAYIPGTGCTIYDQRPDVCRGYPFYNGSIYQINKSCYPGCGFEKAWYYKRLLQILNNLADNAKETIV